MSEDLESLRREIERDAGEALDAVERNDPYRELKVLFATYGALRSFDDEADAAIARLLKTLSEGGIFSRSVQGEMTRLLRILEDVDRRLAKLQDPGLDSKRRAIILDNTRDLLMKAFHIKINLLDLLKEERARADHLAKAMEDYFNDMRLLGLVQQTQRLAKDRKMNVFQGPSRDVTASLLGSFNYTRGLFDTIKQELDDRVMRYERQCMDSLTDFTDAVKGQADRRVIVYGEMLRKDRELLAKLLDEMNGSLNVIREAAQRLRDEHRVFQKESGELKHLLDFLQLMTKRYEKERRVARSRPHGPLMAQPSETYVQQT